MAPSVTEHLLTLCAIRRAEITLNIRVARQAGRGDSPAVTSLLAEQLVNDAAIAELRDALAVAA